MYNRCIYYAFRCKGKKKSSVMFDGNLILDELLCFFIYPEVQKIEGKHGTLIFHMPLMYLYC